MSILRRCRWRTLASRGTRGTAVPARRGATYMIVLVAMPALLGAAACAVDLSLMSAAGQRVQNVVDQAALSGARSYADEATARAVAEQVVAANNAEATWQVSTETVIYSPGQTVPGYGTLGPQQYAVDITGQAQFSYMFGRFLGLETTQVRRRAAARLDLDSGGAGTAFIWAGATQPGYDAVKVFGQQTTVLGTIHSNSDIFLGGIDITGDLNYVGDVKLVGGVQHDGDTVQVPIEACPLDYTWEELSQPPPGGWDYEIFGDYTVAGSDAAIPSGFWRIHGDMTVSGNGATCLNSVFVVDGRVSCSASDKNFDGVTIIALGTITLSGAGSYYSPYQDNLLAVSFAGDATTIGEQAVSINAAGCELTGIVYAPNGDISFNGSDEYVYYVGLIAETVTIMDTSSTYSSPAAEEQQADRISAVQLIL